MCNCCCRATLTAASTPQTHHTCCSTVFQALSTPNTHCSETLLRSAPPLSKRQSDFSTLEKQFSSRVALPTTLQTTTTCMFSSNNAVLPAKIQPKHLRPLAYRILSKKYGLIIKSDGLNELADVIGKRFGTDWKKNSETTEFLNELAILWKQKFTNNLFVDSIGVQRILIEINEKNCYDVSINSNNTNITNEPINADLDEIIDPNTTMEHNIDQTNDSISVATSGMDWEDYFKIINSNELKKFIYNKEKRQFTKVVNKPTPKQNRTTTSIFKLPTVNHKTDLISNRYYLIRDRLLRNESLQNNDTYNPLTSMINLKNDIENNNLDTSKPSNYMNITQIKNLLGNDRQNFLLLGMLYKNHLGNWALEDPSGTIEIDIQQTEATDSLYYVPGCLVLVEGIYFTIGNKFHCTSMTHPPGENRIKTMDAIGNLDFLEIYSKSTNSQLARLNNDFLLRLHYLENELLTNRILFLGGALNLNNDDTIRGLQKIFQKLSNLHPSELPIMIVFNGPFAIFPLFPAYPNEAAQLYKTGFDNLAELLQEYQPFLENTKLVFIPGNLDPTSSQIYKSFNDSFTPDGSLNPTYTKKLRRLNKNIIWATNPTRLAYLSHEIVILNDELADRFKRYNIEFPLKERQLLEERELRKHTQKMGKITINENETESDQVDEQSDSDLDEKNDDNIYIKYQNEVNHGNSELNQSIKYIKTILDQGHLSPFLPDIRPVTWDLDHALTLYPIPSTLIVCDSTAPLIDMTYNGCKVINTGTFLAGSTARYMWFNPSTKTAERWEEYI